MRAVIGRGDPGAPVVFARRDAQAALSRHRMIIFALGISDRTNLTGLIHPTHLLIKRSIGIILGQHIGLAAFFDRPAQRHPLGQGGIGRRLAHYVETRFQRFDGEGRVLMKIIGQHHRIHIVRKKLVIVGIGRHPELLALLLQALLPGVAERHQFHPHTIRRAAGKAMATADTDHPYANFVHLNLAPFRASNYPSSRRIPAPEPQYPHRPPPTTPPTTVYTQAPPDHRRPAEN